MGVVDLDLDLQCDLTISTQNFRKSHPMSHLYTDLGQAVLYVPTCFCNNYSHQCWTNGCFAFFNSSNKWEALTYSAAAHCAVCHAFDFSIYLLYSKMILFTISSHHLSGSHHTIRPILQSIHLPIPICFPPWAVALHDGHRSLLACFMRIRLLTGSNLAYSKKFLLCLITTKYVSISFSLN